MHSFRELFFSPKYPQEIIKQYYINLRVEFDNTCSKYDNLPTDITDKIEALFKESKMTWGNAYEIEQHLAHIWDAETLKTDLKRHLVSYGHHFSTTKYNHYKKEIAEVLNGNQSIETKRSLLLRMLNALHSFYTERAECLDYGFIIRVRTAIIYLIGFALFISSLVYCYYAEHMPLSSELLLITVTSGFFGASFSMLTSLKKQLALSTIEDFKIHHRLIYILKRPFIGVGAAVDTLLFYPIWAIKRQFIPNLTDARTGAIS